MTRLVDCRFAPPHRLLPPTPGCVRVHRGHTRFAAFAMTPLPTARPTTAIPSLAYTVLGMLLRSRPTLTPNEQRARARRDSVLCGALALALSTCRGSAPAPPPCRHLPARRLPPTAITQPPAASPHMPVAAFSAPKHTLRFLAHSARLPWFL